jgi:Zn-dependent metalloprotease
MRLSSFRPAIALIAGATGLLAQETLRPASPEQAAVERAVPKRGHRRAAARPSSRAYAGTRLDAARQYLRDFSRIREGDLRHVQTRQIGAHSFVRFQQTIGGIPVRGAEVTVRINADNSASEGRSSVRPGLPVSGEWNLDDHAAVERAESQGMTAMEPPTASKIFVEHEGAAIPAWRVVLRSADPAGDWEFLISAEDGAILGKQNLRHGDRPLGYAYPSNPVRGDAQQVPLDNLTSPTSLVSAQTAVFSYYPALTGQADPNTFVQLAQREDGNFFFKGGDPRFSEVQLYYGMERVNARFRALGWPGYDQPLPGIVLYQDYDSKQGKFVGSNNAFFTSQGPGPDGGMFFYLTANNGDTSLDTDVIFHEYTHSIVNWLVGPNQTVAFQALNEGTADYFSDSFLNDPVMGEFAARIFGSRTPYIRRGDNTLKWPYSTVGEAHTDGNIWSGALWDVRAALGPEMADNIAINAVAMLDGSAEFYDAASAAVEAAGYLYGEDAASVVADIMASRGIYSDAAETSSQAITIPAGKSADGRLGAASAGRLLLASQQYRVQVPMRASRLRIRLDSNTDVRFYIRYRVPITIEEGRIQAEQVSATGTSVAGSLTLDSLPELQAGIYYIGVVNASTQAAQYTLQVSVAAEDGSGPIVTRVDNGSAVSGSAPSGPFLASRQFAVDVPEGVKTLRILLDGNQDVDLYVRIGRPLYVNDAGGVVSDFASETESSSESVTLSRNDGGTLPAGLYFIGVLNYSNSTAQFRVAAQY